MAQKRLNRRIGLVHTQRSTSTKNFVPAGPPELSGDTKSVLIHLEMENSTGDVTARPAVRYSDDGDTSWGAAADIGTETLTANGQLNSTTWNNLPGTPKMHLQYGANVYNSSGSTLEFCTLAMRVEKRNF